MIYDEEARAMLLPSALERKGIPSHLYTLLVGPDERCPLPSQSKDKAVGCILVPYCAAVEPHRVSRPAFRPRVRQFLRLSSFVCTPVILCASAVRLRICPCLAPCLSSTRTSMSRASAFRLRVCMFVVCLRLMLLVEDG